MEKPFRIGRTPEVLGMVVARGPLEASREPETPDG